MATAPDNSRSLRGIVIKSNLEAIYKKIATNNASPLQLDGLRGILPFLVHAVLGILVILLSHANTHIFNLIL